MSWRDKNQPVDLNDHWFGQTWFGGVRHRGRWLRRPRTTQERRAWDPEFGRAKRSPCRLPQAWDDILIQSQESRSWKRHRSTQYKAR
jgi:hypothetical protein